MPELAVDPGDAGHEALAFDGAKYRARVRIDLMDLALAVLSDPERAFGPGQSGIVTTARRGDRGEHLACCGVDLLDAILCDLEQVPAVERRARMCGDIERTRDLAVGRIETIQFVARCEPDMGAVIGDAVHGFDARKRAVLPDDLGGGTLHLLDPCAATNL